MARIIEYDERDYGGGGGAGVGSAGVLVVVVLVILYLSGYLPWFSSAAPNTYNQGYVGATVPLAPAAVGNLSYVTAERLNMRESPGSYSMVTYILPRGTKVVLLGNSYREPDGDLWVQVQIDMMEGVQTGWVNRQYIS